MLMAPKWGDTAQSDREKAHRRQPEGPSIFSQSEFGYSASRLDNQEQATKGPAIGADGTKVLRNAGQLKKVIKRIVALIKLRYGNRGCPREHAVDLYRIVAAAEIAAEALDPGFVRDRHNWSARHLRTLDRQAKVEVERELSEHPVEITQRWIGEQAGLRDIERTAIEFYDAEAIDLSEADRLTQKKSRRAAQARLRRETKDGATPRTRCRARLREQDPETSTSTWYYRHPAEPRI